MVVRVVIVGADAGWAAVATVAARSPPGNTDETRIKFLIVLDFMAPLAFRCSSARASRRQFHRHAARAPVVDAISLGNPVLPADFGRRLEAGARQQRRDFLSTATPDFW